MEVDRDNDSTYLGSFLPPLVNKTKNSVVYLNYVFYETFYNKIHNVSNRIN